MVSVLFGTSMSEDHDTYIATGPIRIAVIVTIMFASALSFQKKPSWLQNVGLIFMSPVSLGCIISLVNGTSANAFVCLLAMLLSNILKINRGRSLGRNFFATSLLTIQLCLLLGLPVLWGCMLLASFLTISLIEHVPSFRNDSLDYVGANFGLSSYERTTISAVWSVLLLRLVESLYANNRGLNVSTTLQVYRTYSVEQHLHVVEMVSMAVLCVLLVTELSVFATIQIVNTCTPTNSSVQRRNTCKKNASTSTNTVICIRWSLFVLVALVYAYYILLPLLQSINISNLPLYILQLVFREGFYELMLCINWVLLIIITVVAGFYAGTQWRWPRTCSRKLFHFLVVVMFTPCLGICSKLTQYALYNRTTNANAPWLLVDLDGYQYRVFAFLVLALGVAVNVFVLFEYARLCLVPRTNNATSSETSKTSLLPITVIEQYMQLFLSSPSGSTTNITYNSSSVDVRGKLEISHISLLLGCAGPVWLFVMVLNALHTNNNNNIGTTHSGDSCTVGVPVMLLSIVPYVGLLTLGVGDACAAIVGKIFGKYRWYAIVTRNGVVPRNTNQVDNNRTLEGSFACFISMIVFGMYILYTQYTSLCGGKLFPLPPDALWDALIVLIVVSVLVTVVEAVTQENDNVLLPVFACILLLDTFALF